MPVLYARRVPRTMIVGHGGRESALAFRMAEHSRLYAFMGHANPTIVRHAEASGGSHAIGDVCDPRAVASPHYTPRHGSDPHLLPHRRHRPLGGLL